jgi:hypothetical protein
LEKFISLFKQIVGVSGWGANSYGTLLQAMDSTAKDINTPSVSTAQPLPQQPSAPPASESEPSRASRKARPRKQAEVKPRRAAAAAGAQASSSPGECNNIPTHEFTFRAGSTGGC